MDRGEWDRCRKYFYYFVSIFHENNQLIRTETETTRIIQTKSSELFDDLFCISRSVADITRARTHEHKHKHTIYEQRECKQNSSLLSNLADEKDANDIYTIRTIDTVLDSTLFCVIPSSQFLFLFFVAPSFPMIDMSLLLLSLITKSTEPTVRKVQKIHTLTRLPHRLCLVRILDDYPNR